MNTNHTPGTLYPVGTRYSNSIVYDEATAEVVHGWQVFRQMTPEGGPTGRRSFINNQGTLCGVEIAWQERQRAIVDTAHEMLDALREVLADSQATADDELGSGQFHWVPLVRAAVAKAAGI